ncbi:hypothetical protein JTB14_031802 [Gonioctena quinquepunctata]|nr:hypothetical protein JTB14_031802 [Gonioctena quinquepunctata]
MGFKLANDISQSHNYIPLRTTIPNSFVLLHTDTKEDTDIINNLKLNEDPGYDKIRAKSLKISNKYISEPLVYIFNLSSKKVTKQITDLYP